MGFLSPNGRPQGPIVVLGVLGSAAVFGAVRRWRNNGGSNAATQGLSVEQFEVQSDKRLLGGSEQEGQNNGRSQGGQEEQAVEIYLPPKEENEGVLTNSLNNVSSWEEAAEKAVVSEPLLKPPKKKMVKRKIGRRKKIPKQGADNVGLGEKGQIVKEVQSGKGEGNVRKEEGNALMPNQTAKKQESIMHGELKEGGGEMSVGACPSEGGVSVKSEVEMEAKGGGMPTALDSEEKKQTVAPFLGMKRGFLSPRETTVSKPKREENCSLAAKLVEKGNVAQEDAEGDELESPVKQASTPPKELANALGRCLKQAGEITAGVAPQPTPLKGENHNTPPKKEQPVNDDVSEGPEESPTSVLFAFPDSPPSENEVCPPVGDRGARGGSVSSKRGPMFVDALPLQQPEIEGAKGGLLALPPRPGKGGTESYITPGRLGRTVSVVGGRKRVTLELQIGEEYGSESAMDSKVNSKSEGGPLHGGSDGEFQGGSQGSAEQEKVQGDQGGPESGSLSDPTTGEEHNLAELSSPPTNKAPQNWEGLVVPLVSPCLSANFNSDRASHFAEVSDVSKTSPSKLTDSNLPQEGSFLLKESDERERVSTILNDRMDGAKIQGPVCEGLEVSNVKGFSDMVVDGTVGGFDTASEKLEGVLDNSNETPNRALDRTNDHVSDTGSFGSPLSGVLELWSIEGVLDGANEKLDERLDIAGDKTDEALEGRNDSVLDRTEVGGPLSEGLDKCMIKEVLDRATEETDGVLDTATEEMDILLDRATEEADTLLDRASEETDGVLNDSSEATHGVSDVASDKTDRLLDRTNDKTDGALDRTNDSISDGGNVGGPVSGGAALVALAACSWCGHALVEDGAQEMALCCMLALQKLKTEEENGAQEKSLAQGKGSAMAKTPSQGVEFVQENAVAEEKRLRQVETGVPEADKGTATEGKPAPMEDIGVQAPEGTRLEGSGGSKQSKLAEDNIRNLWGRETATLKAAKGAEWAVQLRSWLKGTPFISVTAE